MNYGAVGEKLVQQQLILKGIEHTYLANDSGQEGWDIVCYKNHLSIIRTRKVFATEVKIQVKTCNWIQSTSQCFKYKPNGDFDFLVLVVLNFDQTDDLLFFVFSKDDFEEKAMGLRRLITPNNKIGYAGSTKTVSFRSEEAVTNHFSPYKNGWGKIIMF